MHPVRPRVRPITLTREYPCVLKVPYGCRNVVAYHGVYLLMAFIGLIHLPIKEPKAGPQFYGVYPYIDRFFTGIEKT